MRLNSCVWLVASAMLSACFVDRARYVAGNSEAGSDATAMTDASDGDGGLASDAQTGQDVQTAQDAQDVTLPMRAPRLLSPLSSTNVASRVFKVNVEFDGMFYVQLNRRSTFDGESGGSVMNRGTGVIATSFTIAPTVANPRGLWFMRACEGVSMTACSPTWTINVLNDAMTPVSESGLGVAADMNGTSSADVLVASRTPPGAHLLRALMYTTLATSMGPPATSFFDECTQVHAQTPAACASYTAGFLLGRAGAILGDADGDGRAEAAFYGEQGAAGEIGTIAIINGEVRPEGMRYFGRLTANRSVRFLPELASAGDFNGDGLADLAVLVQDAMMRPRVDVFLAGPGTGTDPLPYSLARRVLLQVPSDGQIPLPARVTGVGDINGDGYADVAVRGQSSADGSSQLWIYLGNRDPMTTAPTLVRGSAATRANLAATLVGGGDANGDGRADVYVTHGDGAVAAGLLIASIPAGATSLTFSEALPSPVVAPDGSGGIGLIALVGGGDTNGDGLLDAVMVDNANTPRTIAAIERTAGRWSVNARLIRTSSMTDTFAQRVVVRDVNDDGRSEIIVPYRINGVGSEGTVHVYSLVPMATTATRIATISNTDPANLQFGTDVF